MTSGLDAMPSLPATSITAVPGGDVLPMSSPSPVTIPSTNGSALPVLRNESCAMSTTIPRVCRPHSAREPRMALSP
jgi:hypothetical protein